MTAGVWPGIRATTVADRVNRDVIVCIDRESVHGGISFRFRSCRAHHMNRSCSAHRQVNSSECGSARIQLVRDLLKQAPLLAPVDPADNGPQVSLVEACAVVRKDRW